MISKLAKERMEMDNKIKAIIAVAVVAVGMIGYTQISKEMNKDPEITGLQAEFVGKVGPGGSLSKNMFKVTGTTEAGKVVQINDFSSKTTTAAESGASCEVNIEAQGQSATVIVDITREPVLEENIGYPNEKSAKVTCYSNGDLEFTGKGDITNFTTFPWSSSTYSHVYIDDSLKIENMDNWFEGNENLVYCDNLPKTLKTMKSTFAGCTAIEKTPDYFQCSNLKIMDYAFSGCSALKEADIIPVNVSSMKYTYADCISLQSPISLDKTSNLTNVSGLYSGCTSLREATTIPDSVIYMNETYKDCINIKEAVKFPKSIEEISAAYAGCTGLLTGATIPESVINFTDCYNGCESLNGKLEINSDSDSFEGVLMGATTNGDKLSISGNCGNLLAIQKNASNSNIVMADPEAASKQNERLNREKENQ